MKRDLDKELEQFNREVTIVHIPDTITVMSPYKLTPAELQTIKKLLPSVKDSAVKNVVDENIYSGVVIKVGSKMIDLTLNGALQNLKKQMYESN
jgi:F0F1-type ATP synthase delta subunit